jgi:hypothetical protein
MNHLVSDSKPNDVNSDLLVQVSSTATSNDAQHEQEEDLHADPADEQCRDSGSPHKLTVLFFILAQGALYGLSLPIDSQESGMYFDLGRAALNLRPTPFEWC